MWVKALKQHRNVADTLEKRDTKNQCFNTHFHFNVLIMISNENEVILDPFGKNGGTDLRFLGPRPGTSRICMTTDPQVPVCRTMCLFTPHLTLQYQIILVADRGKFVWKLALRQHSSRDWTTISNRKSNATEQHRLLMSISRSSRYRSAAVKAVDILDGILRRCSRSVAVVKAIGKSNPVTFTISRSRNLNNHQQPYTHQIQRKAIYLSLPTTLSLCMSIHVKAITFHHFHFVNICFVDTWKPLASFNKHNNTKLNFVFNFNFSCTLCNRDWP